MPIESLLGARKANAEDQIWALREDPGYIADNLYDMRGHRLEMLEDVNGQAHPTTKPPKGNIRWSRVIGNVLVESQFSARAVFGAAHPGDIVARAREAVCCPC